VGKNVFRAIALFIPYIAIGIGLFLFKSGWLAIGLYHAGMIFFLVLDRSRPPFRLVLKGWNKTWAWLILFCALSGVAIQFLWPWMQQQVNLDVLLPKYGLSDASWIRYVFYYSLFHPALEEYYWRGYLGHYSKRIRIEDVAFAGYHFFTMLCFVQWPWALLTFLILTGMAWLWRQSARQTEGLLIPTLAHMAAAVSISLAVSFLLRSA